MIPQPDNESDLSSVAWEAVDDRLRDSPSAEIDSAELSQSTIELLRLLNNAFQSPDDLANDDQALPAQIGRYEIMEVAGRGRFGIVYKARDPESNLPVAIKCIKPEFIDSPEHRRRFVREAEVLAQCDHPDIVRLLDAGRDKKRWFMVFAFCEGSSLEEWLANQQSRVSPRLAAQIVMRISLAVHHGHQRGIVHRDLKPSNVMMVPDSASPIHFSPKVLDFGFARSLSAQIRETSSAIVVGTPLYMAPEQSKGASAPICPATDVFALGAILYEMLAGKPPFWGETVLQIAERLNQCEPPGISSLDENIRDLERICRKCLKRSPLERYPHGLALAEELSHWLESRPISISDITEHLAPPDHSHRSHAPISRRKVLSCGIAATGLVAIGGYWNWPGLDREPATSRTPLSSIDDSVDRQLAELVISLGGSVDVTMRGESTEASQLSQLPTGPFALTWIMLPRCKSLSDDHVEQFTELQSLVGIDLYATNISDVAARSISKVASLREVFVHNTPITDIGATAILKLPILQGINLNWTKIGYATFLQMAARGEMRKIKVRGNSVSDFCIRELSGLTGVEILDAGENPLTDRAFEFLAATWRHVTEIEIDRTQVTDQVVETLIQWPLQRMRCSREQISPAAIKILRQKLPNCRIEYG